MSVKLLLMPDKRIAEKKEAHNSRPVIWHNTPDGPVPGSEGVVEVTLTLKTDVEYINTLDGQHSIHRPVLRDCNAVVVVPCKVGQMAHVVNFRDLGPEVPVIVQGEYPSGPAVAYRCPGCNGEVCEYQVVHCKKCKCLGNPGLRSGLRKCSRCLAAYYCSKECQKHDWASHKAECTVV